MSNEQDVEPDAWLVKHEWIVNKNRSDRKIAMSHPLSSHNNYSEPEPLYSAETNRNKIEKGVKSEEFEKTVDNKDELNGALKLAAFLRKEVFNE